MATSMVTAAGVKTEKRPTTKLDTIRDIERRMQKLWADLKIFEVDAPDYFTNNSNTYFVTFPYPYMNGRLHLGHTFSLSKCEFAVGFQRLRGKHCLFPFGFHCTGMPIRAAADKLKRELEQFGFPPKFPIDANKKVEVTKIMTPKESPANILPSQLTIDVWDYIFFPEKSYPSSTTDIPRAILDHLRNEFQYWYPVDLRSSGKDLIPNHLTYSIYNHIAVWPNHSELWPRAFRANGHLLLNGEKMAKITGNFLTLSQAIKKFSADGVRLTLADAGDSIEDANFEEEMAEAQLLRLYAFIEWVKEVLDINLVDIDEENNSRNSSDVNWIKDKLHLSSNLDNRNEEFTEKQKINYRIDTKYNYYDHVFESEINRAIQLTEESYEKMLYKDVLKYGFFELQTARDNYRELCLQSERMNLHLIKQFIEIQVILLAPICPHICDYLYQFLYPGTTIMNAKWPKVGKVDQSLIDSRNYLMNIAHDFRLHLKSYINQQTISKSKRTNTQSSLTSIHATIFVAHSYPSWQTFIINELKQLYLSNNHSLPDSKKLAVHFKDCPEIDKKYQKKLMPFVIYLKELLEKSDDIISLDRHLSFDENQILQLNQDYLRRAIHVEQIDIRLTDGNDTDTTMLSNLEDIVPGKPLIHFRHETLML
ncbi:unnamed protein product [Rotaria sp. Silwood1]|nr:unnamed protein product [Rotaria sp. Silwood1]